MRKRILFFHQTFFGRSETFIYQHALCTEEYFDIFLCAPEIINLESYPLKHAHYLEIDRNESRWSIFFKKIWWKLGDRFVLGFNEKKQLKEILTRHKIDLIHAQFGYNGARIFRLAKALKIPLVVSFHGYDASDKIFKQFSYQRILKPMMDYASKLLVVSNHMPDRLGMTSRQRGKVHYLPYLVDTEYFRPTNTEHEESPFVDILHSGRLTAKKCVPNLVRAFIDLARVHNHLRLHIVGEGEDRAEIENLARDSEFSDRIFLYGALPHSEIFCHLDRTDIFVLNSATAPDGDMEGLPVSLLEAMSMGKAVIGTRHAGITAVLRDGENGLMINERDLQGLRGALHTLISDKALRCSLGQAARMTIEKDYSLQNGRYRWRDFYSSIL